MYISELFFNNLLFSTNHKLRIFNFRAKTLKTAIQICTQIKDCGGITKVKNDYELRGGNTFMKSDDGEESWIIDKLQSSNCIRMPSEVIDEEKILDKHPKLRNERICGKNGYYHYNDKYSHLNSLLKDGIKYSFFYLC